MLDALDSGDFDKFADELGDLLLQIIFHADLAATVAFREELVLVTARPIKNLAALRAATPTASPAPRRRGLARPAVPAPRLCR